MGNLGAQELLLCLLSLLIFFGLPVFFYWLGKRSGYKQGQLEMYRKIDEERRNSGRQ